MADNLQTLFSQAFILGGSPCSGKSMIAEMLSVRFGLQYYKIDDHEREHVKRCQPDRHPVIYKVLNMSPNENFSRPVGVQVQEEFEFYRERFEMILEDLRVYDPEVPIIMEGAAYLPELLADFGVRPQQVLYLVPTKEFQVKHYSKRPWIQYLLKECDDPKVAFENWMERDHLFGVEILRQAKAFGYKSILVDGEVSMDAQFEQVARYLGLIKP
jgi:hypothetical protein